MLFKNDIEGTFCNKTCPSGSQKRNPVQGPYLLVEDEHLCAKPGDKRHHRAQWRVLGYAQLPNGRDPMPAAVQVPLKSAVLLVPWSQLCVLTMDVGAPVPGRVALCHTPLYPSKLALLYSSAAFAGLCETIYVFLGPPWGYGFRKHIL